MKKITIGIVSATIALFALSFSVALADTVNVNFEPSTYTVGNINAQDGWTSTGSYDQGVVASPVISGSQSFRISNAVTSGSFGDQTFSKPLTDSAGETGSDSSSFPQGTLQPHFESQFTIKAIPNSIGDVMSVSPDTGNGGRMSYLRFDNESDGIHVYFDDVQGTTNPANFVETQIALLDNTTAHTVKFSIDFVNGPSNDVVKIYIDGNLAHIGTTWENYYRFDIESNPSLNPAFTHSVRSMLFRAGGTAVPANSGKGFLIDDLSLMSGPTPVVTSSTIVVQQADLETNLANAASSGKWYFYDDTADTLNNTLGTFVTGPGTPPLGTGSAEVTLADGTSRVFLTNSKYGGTLLSTMSTFGFSEYSHSGSGVSATEVPFVRFNVDFTGSNVFQGSLVYEPNDNSTVTQDGWQTWDMINNGSAKWEYTNHIWPTTATGPDAGVVGQSGNIARTWNAIIADYPSIQMLASGPQVGVRVGEPGPAGYVADADAFTIGVGNTSTTYDFEPTSVSECDANASQTIVSDALVFDATDGHNAALVTPHPAWTTISGSTWIYSDPLDSNGSSPIGTKVFTRTFNLVGTPIDSTLMVAADNYYTVSVNGHALNTGTSGTNLNNFSSAQTWTIPASDLVTGANIISFTVTNPGINPADNQPFGDPNPAGLLFKITANDNECEIPPPPTSVKVTIDKFVDGSQATAVSANNSSFSMKTTYSAANIGSGTDVPFSIGPVGFNSPNPYEAVTSDMTPGANYKVSENVQTTCDGTNPFALVGYTTGDSLAIASAGFPTLTIPDMTNITTNKYVIVWNKTCTVTPPIKVHILKYLDGQEATAVSANNYLFPMVSTWNATNIGSGTGSYVLGNNFGGATELYGADTAPMSVPADYTTNEVTDNTSQVLPPEATCSAGKYKLVGYTTSDTSFADAATKTPTTTVPNFVQVGSDEYVIVWNVTCHTTPPPPPVPTDKNQCKENGWKTLVDDKGHHFKNQGDCVSFVATKGKNKGDGN